MFHCPTHQTTYRLEQGRTQVGEGVLHLRWHDRVDRAFHEAIALKLTEHILDSFGRAGPRVGDLTDGCRDYAGR